MLVLSFDLVKQLISTNLFSTDQGKREMRFKEIQSARASSLEIRTATVINEKVTRYDTSSSKPI